MPKTCLFPERIYCQVETHDVVCACHYEWLCAPKGAGFFYARPAVQHLLKPLIVSWGYESETPSGSAFVDYNDWWGTHDISAFLAVPTAIEFQQNLNWDAVRKMCHGLLCDAQQRICEITGLPPLHALPRGDHWFAQMAAAPLPATTNNTRLKTQLYDEYRIEIPLVEWQGNKLIRISVQGYNTERDMDILCRALSYLLERSNHVE